MYGGKASARPRSLPHGDEGNFARIRPKDTASAEIFSARQRRALAVRKYKNTIDIASEW